MMISSAMLCLAMNVYFEARSESTEGQLAVAYVTLNRANQQNTDVCEVVYQHKQFSWTNNRFIVKKKKCGTKVKVLNPKWYAKYKIDKDSKAWKMAIRVAKFSVTHKHLDVTKGSTFYHATYVDPYWRTAYQQVVKIGQHIFYKKA